MDLIRESLAITIVFALLWAALWLLRRKGMIRVGQGRMTGEHHIESIDKLRLTPQHSVHVVRVGERRIVLGIHGSGFTVLGEMSVSGNDTGTNAHAAGAR